LSDLGDGKNINISDNLNSCTNQVAIAYDSKYNLAYHDCPGFNDTNLTRTKIYSMLVQSLLTKENNEIVKFNAILYVHSLENDQFSGTDNLLSKIVENLCDTDNIILILTKGDNLANKDMIQKRSNEIISHLKKKI